jgi:uncharacterized protein
MKHSVDTIPIFPLNAVLFPGGRLPLQIFEQRYLTLLSRALRSDTGFGICLLKEGDEVAKAGVRQMIHMTGTYARVVDWETLPNGLLGITAEGVCKFTVLDYSCAEDELMRARVEFSLSENIDQPAIETGAEHDSLVQLLRKLMDHPAIERLNLSVNYDNLRELGWRLSELLPIPAEQRQALLEIDDTLARIHVIEQIVNRISDEC